MDKPVKIYVEGYEKLKTYSQLTGIPIKRVIADMIDDWMDSVGQARLEALCQATIVANDPNQVAVKGQVIPFVQTASTASN